MTIIDACNTFVSLDIDGVEKYFQSLSLLDFLDENVSYLATTTLKLIKVMENGYVLPVGLGLDLIKKATTSTSSYFNLTIFNTLDYTLEIEMGFRTKNPKLLHLYPYILNIIPSVYVRSCKKSFPNSL